MKARKGKLQNINKLVNTSGVIVSYMKKLKLEDIVVVTSNKNKLAEINSILGINHKVSKINVPEIQSLDLDEVITAKVKTAFSIIKNPVMVTDVSLELEGLKGLPGTFVKYFINTVGSDGIGALLNGRSKKAKAIEAEAIYDGKNLKIFKGSMKGHIISKNRGTNGFGFDRVFVPKGYEITFAQMPTSIKNKISHRAEALRKVKKYLDNNE